MKKLLFLLPLAALFAACAKRETVKPALTPATVTAADIQGKWATAVDTLYTMQNNQTTTTVQDISGENLSFTYDQNSIGARLENGITTPYTYNVSGGVIKMNESGTEEDFIILAISADRIIIRLNDGTQYIDAALIKQ